LRSNSTTMLAAEHEGHRGKIADRVQ